MSDPIPIGTRTPWGTVAAIGQLDGERYYWFVDDDVKDLQAVAMLPACTVEEAMR